jgi:hypothetical protein
MTLPMICLDFVDCLLMTRPLVKEHLKLIICVLWFNIDLNNITHWGKQWLVKLKIQILHMMSTAHFLQLFTNTYRTLKDLFDVYVLLTHLRATTQHQSQYILQYYVIFLT